jgi:hypothetical protein
MQRYRLLTIPRPLKKAVTGFNETATDNYGLKVKLYLFGCLLKYIIMLHLQTINIWVSSLV